MFDFMGIIRARNRTDMSSQQQIEHLTLQEFEAKRDLMELKYRRSDPRDTIFLNPEIYQKAACEYCKKLYDGSETICKCCGAMRTR